ncbi:MAG: DNA-protecting protein DprA [Bacteroidota bacterium]
MNDEELLYLLALVHTPNIGDVHSRTLLQHFHSAKDIFSAPSSRLEKMDGIGTIRAKSIKQFSDFKKCEREIKFIRKEKIIPLCWNAPGYPKRLTHCHDAPVLLFYKGTVDLNEDKFISIVGTRNNTSYGKKFCEKLLNEISCYNAVVVSGLAYGIDSIVHKICVASHIPTIGVLAHGLDRIYPDSNRGLAMDMVECGGLITPFRSGTTPEKQHFPNRNRITAGICDALIVIETGMKGGSLITARLASDYHKEIFALPGRFDEEKSSGCNHLIKTNQASLITSADDIIEALQWKKEKKESGESSLQKSLFPKLEPNEMKLMDILKENKMSDIDSLMYASNLSYGTIASALLNLELNGLVRSLPGKSYALVS